jgi:hypothetical protein
MRRTRTVKACGPDLSMLRSTRDNANALRGDGDKKARSPRRARSKPLKPFARGRPGISGEPVVTNLRVFYFYTQGCGCTGHPAFPAPSHRGHECLKLGQGMSREGGLVFSDVPRTLRSARSGALLIRGPRSRPTRSRLCEAALHAASRPGQETSERIFVHRNKTRVHHPANGQWRFGRLLCKGAPHVTRRPGSAANLARCPSKASGRNHA